MLTNTRPEEIAKKLTLQHSFRIDNNKQINSECPRIPKESRSQIVSKDKINTTLLAFISINSYIKKPDKYEDM